ncbi:hypothetical protein D3C85_1828100 [compost metagenome]
MIPKRLVSWFISSAEEIGRVTSKLPCPMLSAAWAKASIGSPKRRAMACAVTKPMISTANPTSPSRPATSSARSRA